MRYTIICTDAIFFTEWLLFPDWNSVTAIIDNEEQKYVMRSEWSSDQEKPNWKEIISDTL